MPKHGAHEELAAGDAVSVVAICLENGTCPAGEWLDTLNDRQWAAIYSRIKMLANRGWLKSPDALRKLADADSAKDLPSVREIKHSGQNLRMYVVDYSEGDSVAFVTHGSVKPKKNAVAREVARARNIYQEK